MSYVTLYEIGQFTNFVISNPQKSHIKKSETRTMQLHSMFSVMFEKQQRKNDISKTTLYNNEVLSFLQWYIEFR